MRNRYWQATVRNRTEIVDLEYYVDGDEMQVSMVNSEGNFQIPKEVQDRTPKGSKNSHRIWVAFFEGNHQILIDWFIKSDQVTIAYRSLTCDSWQAPATCADLALGAS
jgi:hypothetical protein